MTTFGAIKQRKIRGVNVVSLNYSDGYSNMLDFVNCYE